MLDTPLSMTSTDKSEFMINPIMVGERDTSALRVLRMRKSQARGFIITTVFVFLLVFNSSPVLADSAEITPLSFGRFVVANNGSVSTLRVRHDGRSQVVNGSIYPIEFGTAGEYYLSGFPAFTPLTISISGFDLSTDGPTEEFTISDFTFEDVTTDENGEATLIVGATISTSGNGNSYVDSTYDATINITITF